MIFLNGIANKRVNKTGQVQIFLARIFKRYFVEDLRQIFFFCSFGMENSLEVAVF